MEKTGTILLTQSEAAQVASGVVPERIARDWKLSLTELKEMLNTGAETIPDVPGTQTPPAPEPGKFHSPYTKTRGY